MKRKEINRILIKSITRLRNSAKCISPGCDIEYIHVLRVQFKKLRAFIRLLRHEDGGKKECSIPRPLKKIYKKAGEIRDRQLHYNGIHSYYAQKNGQSVAYLENLSREITARQEDLRKTIRLFSFKGFRSELQDQLPRKLRNRTVREYFHHQEMRYEKLLSRAHSDKSIHAVRKSAKDILYNAELLKHSKPANRILEKKEAFKSIEEAIGDYNNLCMGLSFLRKDLQLFR
jgi:CHAD domain-containing protein